jgi:hypothetical protein
VTAKNPSGACGPCRKFLGIGSFVEGGPPSPHYFGDPLLSLAKPDKLHPIIKQLKVTETRGSEPSKANRMLTRSLPPCHLNNCIAYGVSDALIAILY